MSDSSYIYQEKYLRAKELNAATSDPEKNPFKSKYEARNLLQNIREDVHKLREDRDGDVILSSAEAAVEYLIAVNFINTEEVSAGQEILNHIIEVSDGKLEKDPRFVSTIIAVNNELGLLWSSREEGINKAYEHLTKAEQLYQDFVKNSDETPLCIDDHFVSDVTDRKQAFESLHTNTLYYLAQAHKALGNNDESALFCKKTLQRQLEMKTLVPLEWAVNCACLSQYYITMNMFSEAKHCLACANFVINEISEEEGETKLLEKKADVARCWVKYCICLLEESKLKLSNAIGEMDDNLRCEAIDQSSEDLKSNERFKLEVTSIEEKCPHDYCVNYQQAKQLFQVGKEYATDALKYFVLDGFVTDHIELNQDISRLYQHVSFFEQSYEIRCRMYKRRIDILAAIIPQINPQYYLAVTRQLQFEIAETYSDMMDMKVAIATSGGGRPNQHAVKKINMLCYLSIKYFHAFLDTLRLPDRKFPERFESDVERPGLIAHFYIARLYGKVITSNSSEKLENLKLSLQFYAWVVNYSEINPEAAQCVDKELEICVEMVELLPKSMDRYLLS